MKKELEAAVKAAKEAGKIQKENFNRTHVPTLKADKTWVSEVDKLSESKIISIIGKIFPDHSIQAEESGFSKKIQIISG